MASYSVNKGGVAKERSLIEAKQYEIELAAHELLQELDRATA